MRKIIAFFLATLLLMTGIPVVTSAAEEIKTEFGAYSLDITTEIASAGISFSLVEDADGAYYHGVAKPGTYWNNALNVSFKPESFSLGDYRFVKLCYRTDSGSDIIDTTTKSSVGESWFATHPECLGDGEWHEIILDLNGISSGAGLAPAGEMGITLIMKVFGSQSVTLNADKYFDIKYMAFFKSESDAEAYKYAGENPDEMSELQTDRFIEADEALLQKYIDETDARIAEIENSKTTVEVKGTKYYISSSTGNDANDGKSPETAWKSALKVNDYEFNEGDGVFFKRGDTFRIDKQMNAKSGVTYSAYGEGAKPRIVASIDASDSDNWIKTSHDNLYAYTYPLTGEEDVGTIVFDGGRAWGVQIQKTTQGNWLDIGTVYNGLEYFTVPTGKFTDQCDLSENLEFYHNWDDNTLYLYCKDGNPGEVFSSIEIVDRGSAIGIGNGHDIVIDNLEVFGAGAHGIGAGDIENVTVQYCKFEWIGGSVQSRGFGGANYGVRYGNAVQSYGKSKNFVIRYNYASQIYDCCWTAQYQKVAVIDGLQIYGNVAEYCNTGLEVWQEGGSVTNMKLYDNITRYNGYGFSHQRLTKDANFFYGSSFNSTFENNDIYNNVNYLSSTYAFKTGTPGINQYNFHDNVYIMEEDTYLGNIPANPGAGTGYIGDIAYEYTRVAKALNTGFEDGSMFYVTKPDPLGVDMYTLYSPENGVDEFTDIAQDFWGRDAVDYVALKKYFAGVTATTFVPDTTMTRGMLVTVLSRMAGTTGDINAIDYTDVNKNAWYAPGVAWASENDIVDKGAAFRPDAPATREEMADMLYRYAKYLYKGGSLDGAKTFTDSDKVTAAYADGIKFCTKNGIITGFEDGTIGPKGNATRAQVATMIMRFAKYIETAESDQALALEGAKHLTIAGKDLKQMLDNTYLTAKADGEAIVFAPFDLPGERRSAPMIDILNSLNKEYNFVDYKYAVISCQDNTQGEVTAIEVRRLKVANADKLDVGISSKAEKSDTKIFVDYSDFVGEEGAYDVIFRILPWGTEKKAAPLDDSFVIYEITLFESEVAARAYAG